MNPNTNNSGKKVYIAYKYRYLKDKESLKADLEVISKAFQNRGYDSFILGRDVQMWGGGKHSKISTIFEILNNIGKHDILFVYSNSEVHSNGVPFEIVLARLHGLKTFYARKSGTKESFWQKFIHISFEFNDIPDLLEKINKLF